MIDFVANTKCSSNALPKSKVDDMRIDKSKKKISTNLCSFKSDPEVIKNVKILKNQFFRSMHR